MISSKKGYLVFFSLIFNRLVFAQIGINIDGSDRAVGLDVGFKNMSGVLLSLTDLVLAVTTIGGVGFFFAGIAKFYQHRQNALQTPLSQSIVMFFLAFVLISLPYILLYGKSAYYLIKNI